MAKSSKLKSLVESFNELSDKKKNLIIKCIDKNKLLVLNNFENLTDDEINIFKEIRAVIIDLISKDLDEQKIIRKLVLAGLETSFAQGFYNYCNDYAKLFLDLEYINKMDIDIYNVFLEHIINDFILYNDYKSYFGNHYTKMFGLKGVTELNAILRFTAHHIMEVSSRNISPKLLKLKLENDYGFHPEFAEAFYQVISANIHDLHQAWITEKIKDLVDKIGLDSKESDEDINNT